MLLVFTKNAVLGKVKTRLASDIGNEEALRVHQALVERTVLNVNQCDCDKVVYYSNQIEANGIFLENGYRQEVQSEGDLGERMQQAFSKEFANGYSSIVIIGTDCPEIDEASISFAFTQLEEKDVILGPAHDGGYYLLGLSSLHNALFDDIAWGTSTVLHATLECIHRLSLSFALTTKKHDIDTLADLKMSEFGKEKFPLFIG